jgi:GntR family transcriptional repressor for pyruvate dehydrogenase complex
MQFHPIKAQNSSEMVMEQIKNKIISGQLQPGERLASVVELAEQFGMGRSTIREALSALKAMGWLEIRQGGGTFVSRTLPPAEGEAADPFYRTNSLQELIEVRKYIETGCASLAAERRREDDLRRLAEILTQMENCLSDEKAGEQADIRFHLEIARASHNQLMIHLMESMTSRMQETMTDSRRLWFYAERASAETLLQEHRALFEAIRDRQADLAARRMMNHLLKVEQVLRRQL